MEGKDDGIGEGDAVSQLDGGALTLVDDRDIGGGAERVAREQTKDAGVDADATGEGGGVVELVEGARPVRGGDGAESEGAVVGLDDLGGGRGVEQGAREGEGVAGSDLNGGGRRTRREVEGARGGEGADGPEGGAVGEDDLVGGVAQSAVGRGGESAAVDLEITGEGVRGVGEGEGTGAVLGQAGSAGDDTGEGKSGTKVEVEGSDLEEAGAQIEVVCDDESAAEGAVSTSVAINIA